MLRGRGGVSLHLLAAVHSEVKLSEPAGGLGAVLLEVGRDFTHEGCCHGPDGCRFGAPCSGTVSFSLAVPCGDHPAESLQVPVELGLLACPRYQLKKYIERIPSNILCQLQLGLEGGALHTCRANKTLFRGQASARRT